MSRFGILFLFSAVLLLGNRSAFATNYAVGTCEPKLTSYPTITEAVNTVPAGSIIEVCPGNYPEQFTISKPLTLEGITSGNSNQVSITVPFGGLSENAPSFYAQVYVVAGPVNITNITVDGTANSLGTSTQLAGIYYGAGASGVIKDVETVDQFDNLSGSGIVADNPDSTNESLTIENCSIHDFDFAGILVEGKYTATIKANNVDGSTAPSSTSIFGITDSSAGSVTGNVVIGTGPDAGGQGITIGAKSTISDNTVVNFDIGLADYGAATYTSNSVRNVILGIVLEVAGATAESNTVTQSIYAFAFDCVASTAKNNTINDANTALVDAPSGLSSTNSYFNLFAIRGGTCTGAGNASLPKGMSPPKRPVTL